MFLSVEKLDRHILLNEEIINRIAKIIADSYSVCNLVSKLKKEISNNLHHADDATIIAENAKDL